MTAREQETIQKLSEKLDRFMAEDKRWKDEIELKITPLVDERSERIILLKSGKYLWKGLVTVIGFFVTVGLFVHYLPETLKAFHLH